MKHYEHFELEDFVQDLYFRKWILGRLPGEDQFWEAWYTAHPEKQELLEQARSMVVGLHYEPEETDEQEIGQAVEQVLQLLHPPQRPPFYQTIVFWGAASFFLAALLGLLVWKYRSLPDHGDAADTITRTGIHWKENNSSERETIWLDDGTRVELLPSSKLGIAADFGGATRTVRLIGEAFFEVKRQPERPFYVYSDNIITKVLGTSFWVRSYEMDENVSVSVVSGKVTVQKDGNDKTPETQEFVLTPNQQAVISKKHPNMLKKLVAEPVIIAQTERHATFRFTDTPITEVFQTLEKAYGITISFDPDIFKNCNLTARLTNEALFEKLDLICETIQANYKITDGQILIQGPGCN